MRNELKDIRLIESYLLGTLNDTERLEFENRLGVNKAFNELFKAQQLILKGVGSLGLKQSIKKSAKTYRNQILIKRFLGSLIIISCLGFTGYYFNQNQNLRNNTNPLEITILSTDTIEVQENNLDLSIDSFVEISSDKILDSQDVIKLKRKAVFQVKPYVFEDKIVQVFKINSTKDISIIGQEGTVISIKANSFGKVESNTIELRLKEYYRMSDIAFSNLTTETVDGKILETGGMIYLEAKDINGKELKLEKTIELKFPKKEDKKGMKLFNGELVEEKVKWNEQYQLDSYSGMANEELVEREFFTVVEDMPRFPGTKSEEESTKKTIEFFQKNIIYPSIAKEESISGIVYISYIINENGNIEEPTVVRGVSPILDLEAIRVVSKLPKFSPGTQRKKAVSVKFTIPIKFNLSGVEYSSARKISAFNKLAEKKVDSLMNNIVNTTDFDSTSSGVNKVDLVNYYIFSSSNLGWINCDRFIFNKYNKVNFRVINTEKNIPVKLIFNELNSLMVSYSNNGVAQFNSIPFGKKVTVFSIKMMNNKPFAAFQETIIGKEEFELEYKEVSQKDIKAFKNRINQLN
jgi:TonB family protein